MSDAATETPYDAEPHLVRGWRTLDLGPDDPERNERPATITYRRTLVTRHPCSVAAQFGDVVAVGGTRNAAGRRPLALQAIDRPRIP